MNLADYNPNLSLALALVGAPGTGKTSLSSSAFPKPYLLDCDNNLSGCSRRLKTLDLNLSYDIVNVDSEGNEVKPYDRYRRFSELGAAACANPDYDTLIFDSATAINEYIFDEIKRQANVPEMNRLKTGITMQQWAIFSNFWRNIVTTYRTSGKIIIFTFHNDVRQDEVDGSWKTFLAVPGQNKTTLSGLFSDVWDLRVAKKMRNGEESYSYEVHTHASNSNDQRGIKSSLDLPDTITHEDLLPLIKQAL